MSGTDATAVAEARRWFRCLGHAPIEEDGVSIVATPEHPDTWDANFATARDAATPERLHTALDRAMPHTSWRIVITDELTPPGIEAAVSKAGYTQHLRLIEMLARETVTSPRPLATVALRAVDDPASWTVLAALVREDHSGGDRTGTIDTAVSAGLLDLMRRRSPPCRHWLLVEDGEAVGYGSTAICPGGLSLIEDLFTRPDRRRRGLMSAFIVAAAERLRRDGCTGIFLAAHEDGVPRRLYAALGFRPVALTRTWAQSMGGRS